MIVIGQFAGHQVAAKHAKARGHHYPLHVVWSKMGHLQHDWLHIAIPAIYAGLPQECGQKNQPGSRAAQETHRGLEGSGLAVMARGRQKQNAQKGGAAKKSGNYKSPAPGKRVGQPGGKRHAGQIGHCHAGDHDGHGGGAPAPLHQGCGKNGSHSKIGAVRQAGQKAAGQKTEISLGAGGQRVASANYRAENQQNMLVRAGAQQKRQRRAQRDAQGVCRYKITGRRNADPERTRHRRQHGHHGKFGHAQCKRAASHSQ